MLQPGRLMTTKEVRSPAGQKLINDLMLGVDDFGPGGVYEDMDDEEPSSPYRPTKNSAGGGDQYLATTRQAAASKGGGSSSSGRPVLSAQASGAGSGVRQPSPGAGLRPDANPGRPATAPALSSMLLPPQLPAPFSPKGITGTVSPILEPYLTSRHTTVYPGTVTAVLHAVSSPAVIGTHRDTQRRPGTVPADVYRHSAISPPRGAGSPDAAAVASLRGSTGSPAAPVSAKSRDGSPRSSLMSSPSRGCRTTGSAGPTDPGMVAGVGSLPGGPSLAEALSHGGYALAGHSAGVPVPGALRGQPRRAAPDGVRALSAPLSAGGGAQHSLGGAHDVPHLASASARGGGAYTLHPSLGPRSTDHAVSHYVRGPAFVPHLDRAHNSHAPLACAVDAVARRAEAHKALTRQRMLASHQAAQHVVNLASGGKASQGPLLGHGPAGQQGGVFLYQPRSTEPYELRTDGIIPPMALGLAWDASPGVVVAAAAAAAAAVAAAAAKAEGLGPRFGSPPTPDGAPGEAQRGGGGVHWAAPGGGELPAAWSSASRAAFRSRWEENRQTAVSADSGPAPWGSPSASRRMLATVPSWIAVPAALAEGLDGGATEASSSVPGTAGSGGSPARKSRRSKLLTPANATEAAALAAEAQRAARSHLPPAVRRGYNGQLTPQTVADWELIAEPNRRMMQAIDNVTNLVRGPPSRQAGARRAGRGIGGGGGSRGLRSGSSRGRNRKPGTAAAAATAGGDAGAAAEASRASPATRGRGPSGGPAAVSPAASPQAAAGRSSGAAAAAGASLASLDRDPLAGVVGLAFEPSLGSVSVGAETWGTEETVHAGGESEHEGAGGGGAASPGRGGPLGWGLRQPGTVPIGRASVTASLQPLPTPSAAVAAVIAAGGAAAAAVATLPQWVDTLAAATSPASHSTSVAADGALNSQPSEYGIPVDGGEDDGASGGGVHLPALPGATRTAASLSAASASASSPGGQLSGPRGVGMVGHHPQGGTPSREPSFGLPASPPSGDGSSHYYHGEEVGSPNSESAHHHHHQFHAHGHQHVVRRLSDGESIYHEHSFGSAVPAVPGSTADGSVSPGLRGEGSERSAAGSRLGGLRLAAGHGSEGGHSRTATPSAETSLSLMPGGDRGASSLGGSSSGMLRGEGSDATVRSGAAPLRPGSARPGSARARAGPGARAERPHSAGSAGMGVGRGSRPGSPASTTARGALGTLEEGVVGPAVGAEGGAAGSPGRAVLRSSSNVQAGSRSRPLPQRPSSAAPAGRLAHSSSPSRSRSPTSGVLRSPGRPASPLSLAPAARSASGQQAAAGEDVASVADTTFPASAAVDGSIDSATPTVDDAPAATQLQGHAEAAAAAPQNPVLTPGAGYRVVTSVAAAAIGAEDPRETARLARQRDLDEQLERNAEHDVKFKAASRASRALARAGGPLPPLQPPPAPSGGYSLLKVIQPQRLPPHSRSGGGSLAVLAAPVPEPAELEAMTAAARAALAPQAASRTSPQHHGPPSRSGHPPSSPGAPRRASPASRTQTQDGVAADPAGHASAGRPSAPGRRASTPPSSSLGLGSYMVVQAETKSGRTAQMQDVWAVVGRVACGSRGRKARGSP
ncbi:hypothetical protein GPECTOR_46g230 [Gonium pectorale]|uniref:Uncharacterized protein n=1 Tax=Gonium pectorale TaxID=33097 RepID=A0A150G8M2_GONPE|nr:hypothetical protein GPECTOR_46g230 [Gonium pectorale]|eukprot:KXZ46161.1 hypothetical protein GPECTOR_46g230 [Gonium pectorale]